MILLKKTQVRIELLNQEAKQGFAGGAWSPSVEKEAIRSWLVNCLRSLVDSSNRAETLDRVRRIPGYLASARFQLELLVEVIRPTIQKYHR